MKNRILVVVLCLGLAISISVTYYRTVILQDFMVTNVEDQEPTDLTN